MSESLTGAGHVRGVWSVLDVEERGGVCIPMTFTLREAPDRYQPAAVFIPHDSQGITLWTVG